MNESLQHQQKSQKRSRLLKFKKSKKKQYKKTFKRPLSQRDI
jgi:hypothetical protein